MPSNKHKLAFWYLSVLAITFTNFIVTLKVAKPEFNRYQPNDSSHFYTLSRNLAEYGVYSDDTYPHDGLAKHATWPFAWPTLLAANSKVFGVSLTAAKLLVIILGLINLIVLRKTLSNYDEFVTQFSKTRLGCHSNVANYVTIILALTPIYFTFSRTMMAEVPFMLLTCMTLLAMRKSSCSLHCFFAGVLAAVSFLTRGYAILFLPVGFLYFFLMKEKPRWARLRLLLCFISPLILTVLSWSAYCRLTIEGAEIDYVTKRYGSTADLFQHQSPYLSLKEIQWFHLPAVSEHFSPLFFDNVIRSEHQNLAAFCGLTILFVAFYGLISSGRAAIDPIGTWTISGIAFIIAARILEVRIWLMWYPFILYFFWRGLIAILSRFRLGDKSLQISQTLILLITLLSFAKGLQDITQFSFGNDYLRSLNLCLTWLNNNATDSSLVIAESPEKVFAGTQLPSVLPEQFTEEHRTRHEYIYLILPCDQESIARYPSVSAEKIRELKHLVSRRARIAYKSQYLVLYRLQ